jgi:hypothetical protein
MSYFLVVSAWNNKLSAIDDMVYNVNKYIYLMQLSSLLVVWKRVWRFQRGNQNLYIEEEQTTQWIKEKVKKDKQRSTKHTHKTNDRVTRTPQKLGVYTGRVSSSCSTSGTRRVNQVTNPVIEVITFDNFLIFQVNFHYISK